MASPVVPKLFAKGVACRHGGAPVIRAYSAQQMRDAEAPHLEAGEPLMQRAAAGLAAEIRRQLGGTAGSVLLLVGSGNNGADAMYAGATLALNGASVTIVPTSNRMHSRALAAAISAGARVASVANAQRLAARSDVIVDGILGTGTNTGTALRGTARTVVAMVMPVLTYRIVVAVDIPSGIDPDDGSVQDPVVLAADVTVTFGGYKAGLLLTPGSVLAGRVRLVDIGLGDDLDLLEPILIVPGDPDVALVE
jgi:NAD(P)H-hydrate epimerase